MRFNTEFKKDYDAALKREEKIIKNNPLLKGTSIDPKRQISRRDKEIVWHQAESNPYFDESIFRCDPYGSIAIKGFSYINTSDTQKKFVYDYEHIVSHSENGRSTIENICILNAGINRSKGPKPLTGVNFYEFQGLVKIKSITFEQLLKDLEKNLHSCCNHYELYFYKNNQGKWSIHPGSLGNLYQNYSSTNKYKPCRNEVTFRQNEDLPVEAQVVLAGITIGSFLIVANSVGTQIYKGGENAITFIENSFFKKVQETESVLPPLPKKKEEPSVFTATAIGTVFLGAVAIGLKAYTDTKFKSKTSKKY